jgi:TolB-like protein
LAEGNGPDTVHGAGTAMPEASIDPHPGAVFISYASQDAPAAGRMADTLRAAGIDVWFDQSELRGGDAWDRQIKRQIHDCALFIPVISAQTDARKEGYFRREWRLAVDRTQDMSDDASFLVPVVIDDTPDATARVPDKFREVQWTRLPDGATPAAFAGRILRLLSPDKPVELTSGRVASGRPDTQAAAKAPASNPASLRRSQPALLLIAACVVFGLGYVLIDRLVLSKHPAQTGRVAASAALPVSPAPSSIPDKSIAVLPFTDMSEKKDQEYFADGIAEEVLDRLAKVPGLKVVGRASSFQFNSKSADLASLGTVLGVAYLLEGSVRKDADRVRVTAQLVEARTGSRRWSDRFDSDLVDVLNVQDTIAIEIARALQIAVEADTVPRSSVKSPQVLEAYLRGLESENRESRESSEAAVADYQQALTLDPAFAPAAIGIARVDSFIGAEGWLPTSTVFERAREAAQLAQRLTPKSPEPHVWMARIHTYHDWDWAGADRELQLAFALGSRDTYGAQIASQLAAARGQWDEARQLAIEAIELDPLSPDAHMFLGWNVYLHTGQLPEAEQSFRRGLRIAPKWGAGQYFLGEALMLQGHLEAALAEFQKETVDDGRLEGSAMALFAAGRKAESDSQLAEAIRRNGTSWPSETARTYAFRGDKNRAFEWLDRAYELRDPDIYTFKGDPLFKNLENDPRYKAFLRKMNLPE